MKQVFSLLLTFVFLQAETWAIGGGPQSGGGGAALTGTYAGVLIPVSQTNPPAASQSNNAASVGLFVVGVPSVGVAQGSALAFVNGIAFLGDMTAVADPKKQSLVGVVEGVSNVDATLLVPVVDANGNVTYQTITSKIFAQGSIKADFENGGGNVDPTSGTTSGNRRLNGTATLDLFVNVNADGTPGIFNTVRFRVDGFQQSGTSSTVTITFNPGGNGTGGTGGTGG